MKNYLIAALGMSAFLITLPVQADESIKNAKVAILNSSHVIQAEASSAKSSTLVNNDTAQRGVDCFYENNADEPFCKKQNKSAEKSTGADQ